MRPPNDNDLLSTVLNYSPDLICFIDATGHFGYVSAASQRVLGYESSALVGKHFAHILHPAEAPGTVAKCLAAFEQPAPTRFESRCLNQAGEEVIVEWSACRPPAEAQLLCIGRDVTERRGSSFALAASEQRFRLLFENNPTLAVFQDLDGLVLDINPAFLTFLGRTRAEVVGQPLHALLPAEVRALFQDNFREAIGGSHKAHFEATVQGRNGTQRLKVSKVPLVVEGQLIGLHMAAEDITEMAAAQNLIQQQAATLTKTLESITDAFLSLDRDCNLTFINRKAERLLNMSREQAMGKSIWELFPEGVGGTYQHYHEQALATGETVYFETFFARESRWLEVKLYPVPEGLAIYFADISQRVAAEKQLKLLALVAQDTINGVIITDAAGRVEWVNAGFTRHTGYTLADMLGRWPGQVLQGPETDPAAVRRFRERLRAPKPFSVTILNYQKTGQKLWFAVDVTPIFNDAGELVQFIAIQQNISYRKEVEASQAKMTQELYRHNRDLQQFAYVISHNLRGPLASALGQAESLAQLDRHDPAFDASLASLRASIGQADEVLQDLNLMLSIRDRQDVQAPEPVPLAEVCQQAVAHLADALAQCGGAVSLDLAPGLVAHGNRAYLYSIFYNLLSNSIKYRAEERLLKVDISSWLGAHGGPTISFTDNGSGFDRFKAGSDVFQLYQRFHTAQQGRGIGLFLVKAHVETFGGKIEVRSGVDEGTRFLIHLNQQ